MHDGRRCERHRHLGRQGHRQCLELFQASSVAWRWTSRRGAAWCCGWATGYLVRNGDNLLLLYVLKGHYYEQGRPSSGRPPARVCGGIGMVLSSGWPQHNCRSLPTGGLRLKDDSGNAWRQHRQLAVVHILVG